MHRVQYLRDGRLHRHVTTLHAESDDRRGVASRLASGADRPKRSDRKVLVVGAGPAGFEAALSAARRGYEVHLAEATTELGGRVAARIGIAGAARVVARARLARRPAQQADQCTYLSR